MEISSKYDQRIMATVTKKIIIKRISEKRGIREAEVRLVVQEFLDGVSKALVSGDRCEFRDFGVFEVVNRKAKVGRNPKNPSIEIPIPERNAAKFSTSKRLTTLVENSEAEIPPRKKRGSKKKKD